VTTSGPFIKGSKDVREKAVDSGKVAGRRDRAARDHFPSSALPAAVRSGGLSCARPLLQA